MDKYTSEDYRQYGADRIKNSPFHLHQAAKSPSAVKDEELREEESATNNADTKTGNSESSVNSRTE